MTNAEEKAKQYRDYREQCGIKDPIMLDEIEEAYFEGYLQAEKDLALTWEDVRQIVIIYENVLNDKDFNTLPIKDGYTEVLKRFKKFKDG